MHATVNIPLGTRRCYDVESTSATLIQRRNNVVCPVGYAPDFLMEGVLRT